MTRGTTYTDPFTSTEVMIFPDKEESIGLAYDPRKTAAPVPLSSSCHHCLRGRQKKLSPSTRREVRMLLSKKTLAASDLYQVPTNGRPLTIVYWTQGKSKFAKVIKGTKRSRLCLRVTKRPLHPLVLEGDVLSFRSPILLRCLKFLLSARTSSPGEIAACLHPMVEEERQRPQGPRPRGGRRLPCLEISWSRLMKKIPAPT